MGYNIDKLAVQVVGNGRMGRALVAALRSRGMAVPDAAGRGATGEAADLVVLAVPDAAIAEAAATITPGRMVAHLSGATTLEPLAPHERLSLHPLTTITGSAATETDANPFAGVWCAVAASSDRALQAGEQLAKMLGMRTFEVREVDRTAYHAAASIASNYLVTLEWIAEQLARTAGVSREVLAPLVSAAVDNWASQGAERALTGPVARGDADTVEAQRRAVAERLPQHLAVFDALTAATEALADSRER